MELDQEALKKALRKIGKSVETHGMLPPASFTHEDISLLYSLGVNLYDHSQYEDAKIVFQRLVLAQSHEARFWIALGASLQMLKSYEEALTAWAMASLIEDSNPVPHFHAAECLFSVHQYDEAHKALQEAKQRVQGHEPLVKKIQALEKAWSSQGCSPCQS